MVVANGCFQPLVTLFNATRVYGITHASAERVFNILDQPAPVPEVGTAAPADASPAVRFEGVSFRHHSDGPWAVRDATYEIAPGAHGGAGRPLWRG